MDDTKIKGFKFSEDHIWIGQREGSLYLGLADWAQKHMGEITYVDLPEVKEIIEKGEPFGEIESIKTVRELIAPVSGEVIQINSELESNPTLINDDPFGDGWVLKIKPANADELKELLDQEEYEQLLEEEEDY